MQIATGSGSVADVTTDEVRHFGTEPTAYIHLNCYRLRVGTTMPKTAQISRAGQTDRHQYQITSLPNNTPTQSRSGFLIDPNHPIPRLPRLNA
jgi:hypothetical protein